MFGSSYYSGISSYVRNYIFGTVGTTPPSKKDNKSGAGMNDENLVRSPGTHNIPIISKHDIIQTVLSRGMYGIEDSNKSQGYNFSDETATVMMCDKDPVNGNARDDKEMTNGFDFDNKVKEIISGGKNGTLKNKDNDTDYLSEGRYGSIYQKDYIFGSYQGQTQTTNRVHIGTGSMRSKASELESALLKLKTDKRKTAQKIVISEKEKTARKSKFVINEKEKTVSRKRYSGNTTSVKEKKNKNEEQKEKALQDIYKKYLHPDNNKSKYQDSRLHSEEGEEVEHIVFRRYSRNVNPLSNKNKHRTQSTPKQNLELPLGEKDLSQTQDYNFKQDNSSSNDILSKYKYKRQNIRKNKRLSIITTNTKIDKSKTNFITSNLGILKCIEETPSSNVNGFDVNCRGKNQDSKEIGSLINSSTNHSSIEREDYHKKESHKNSNNKNRVFFINEEFEEEESFEIVSPYDSKDNLNLDDPIKKINNVNSTKEFETSKKILDSKFLSEGNRLLTAEYIASTELKESQDKSEDLSKNSLEGIESIRTSKQKQVLSSLENMLDDNVKTVDSMVKIISSKLGSDKEISSDQEFKDIEVSQTKIGKTSDLALVDGKQSTNIEEDDLSKDDTFEMIKSNILDIDVKSKEMLSSPEFVISAQNEQSIKIETEKKEIVTTSAIEDEENLELNGLSKDDLKLVEGERKSSDLYQDDDTLKKIIELDEIKVLCAEENIEPFAEKQLTKNESSSDTLPKNEWVGKTESDSQEGNTSNSFELEVEKEQEVLQKESEILIRYDDDDVSISYTEEGENYNPKIEEENNDNNLTVEEKCEDDPLVVEEECDDKNLEVKEKDSQVVKKEERDDYMAAGEENKDYNLASLDDNLMIKDGNDENLAFKKHDNDWILAVKEEDNDDNLAVKELLSDEEKTEIEADNTLYDLSLLSEDDGEGELTEKSVIDSRIEENENETQTVERVDMMVNIHDSQTQEADFEVVENNDDSSDEEKDQNTSIVKIEIEQKDDYNIDNQSQIAKNIKLDEIIVLRAVENIIPSAEKVLTKNESPSATLLKNELTEKADNEAMEETGSSSFTLDVANELQEENEIMVKSNEYPSATLLKNELTEKSENETQEERDERAPEIVVAENIERDTNDNNSVEVTERSTIIKENDINDKISEKTNYANATAETPKVNGSLEEKSNKSTKDTIVEVKEETEEERKEGVKEREIDEETSMEEFEEFYDAVCELPEKASQLHHKKLGVELEQRQNHVDIGMSVDTLEIKLDEVKVILAEEHIMPSSGETLTRNKAPSATLSKNGVSENTNTKDDYDLSAENILTDGKTFIWKPSVEVIHLIFKMNLEKIKREEREEREEKERLENENKMMSSIEITKKTGDDENTDFQTFEEEDCKASDKSVEESIRYEDCNEQDKRGNDAIDQEIGAMNYKEKDTVNVKNKDVDEASFDEDKIKENDGITNDESNTCESTLTNEKLEKENIHLSEDEKDEEKSSCSSLRRLECGGSPVHNPQLVAEGKTSRAVENKKMCEVSESGTQQTVATNSESECESPKSSLSCAVSDAKEEEVEENGSEVNDLKENEREKEICMEKEVVICTSSFVADIRELTPEDEESIKEVENENDFVENSDDSTEKEVEENGSEVNDLKENEREKEICMEKAVVICTSSFVANIRELTPEDEESIKAENKNDFIVKSDDSTEERIEENGSEVDDLKENEREKEICMEKAVVICTSSFVANIRDLTPEDEESIKEVEKEIDFVEKSDDSTEKEVKRNTVEVEVVQTNLKEDSAKGIEIFTKDSCEKDTHFSSGAEDDSLEEKIVPVNEKDNLSDEKDDSLENDFISIKENSGSLEEFCSIEENDSSSEENCDSLEENSDSLDENNDLLEEDYIEAKNSDVVEEKEVKENSTCENNEDQVTEKMIQDTKGEILENLKWLEDMDRNSDAEEGSAINDESDIDEENSIKTDIISATGNYLAEDDTTTENLILPIKSDDPNWIFGLADLFDEELPCSIVSIYTQKEKLMELSLEESPVKEMFLDIKWMQRMEGLFSDDSDQEDDINKQSIKSIQDFEELFTDDDTLSECPHINLKDLHVESYNTSVGLYIEWMQQLEGLFNESQMKSDESQSKDDNDGLSWMQDFKDLLNESSPSDQFMRDGEILKDDWLSSCFSEDTTYYSCRESTSIVSKIEKEAKQLKIDEKEKLNNTMKIEEITDETKDTEENIFLIMKDWMQGFEGLFAEETPQEIVANIQEEVKRIMKNIDETIADTEEDTSESSEDLTGGRTKPLIKEKYLTPAESSYADDRTTSPSSTSSEDSSQISLCDGAMDDSVLSIQELCPPDVTIDAVEEVDPFYEVGSSPDEEIFKQLIEQYNFPEENGKLSVEVTCFLDDEDRIQYVEINGLPIRDTDHEIANDLSNAGTEENSKQLYEVKYLSGGEGRKISVVPSTTKLGIHEEDETIAREIEASFGDEAKNIISGIITQNEMKGVGNEIESDVITLDNPVSDLDEIIYTVDWCSANDGETNENETTEIDSDGNIATDLLGKRKKGCRSEFENCKDKLKTSTDSHSEQNRVISRKNLTIKPHYETVHKRVSISSYDSFNDVIKDSRDGDIATTTDFEVYDSLTTDSLDYYPSDSDVLLGSQAGSVKQVKDSSDSYAGLSSTENGIMERSDIDDTLNSFDDLTTEKDVTDFFDTGEAYDSVDELTNDLQDESELEPCFNVTTDYSLTAITEEDSDCRSSSECASKDLNTGKIRAKKNSPSEVRMKINGSPISQRKNSNNIRFTVKDGSEACKINRAESPHDTNYIMCNTDELTPENKILYNATMLVRQFIYDKNLETTLEVIRKHTNKIDEFQLIMNNVIRRILTKAQLKTDPKNKPIRKDIINVSSILNDDNDSISKILRESLKELSNVLHTTTQLNYEKLVELINESLKWIPVSQRTEMTAV